MPKDNSVTIGIIALALIFGGNYAWQNLSQQEEPSVNQEADDRITELEAEIERLKAQAEKTQVEKEKVEKKEEAAKPSHQALNPDELLTQFLADNTGLMDSEIQETLTEIEVKSGPKLSVTPEVFELGEISKAAGLVTATYTLKNEGDKPLTISYAFSSCGCTVAPLKDEKILQPGESYPLEVTYDPNYYGPNFELGPTEKTVTVLSNYAAKPFYKVKLKANIIP